VDRPGVRDYVLAEHIHALENRYLMREEFDVRDAIAQAIAGRNTAV
jgi:hypothetical protein